MGQVPVVERCRECAEQFDAVTGKKSVATLW